MLKIATIMLLGGLSFRLAAVPFHFYAPDVFQGVGPSSAALLSVIPKIVGFAALLRLLPFCLGEASISDWLPADVWASLLTIIAVTTMFLGNLMALRQKNLFRLLGYSSIAHAGYMLVGLTVGNASHSVSGVSALMFYLTVYGIMTLGVFALLTTAGSTSTSLSTLGSLRGLSKSKPVTAILFAVCIFGLSGLPPTAGFLGKLNLFLAAWSADSWQGRTLAISLAINAVIAATYYLRLISAMYFEPESAPIDRSPRFASYIAGGVCAAATLGIFLAPQWLWQAATMAMK